MKSKCYLRDIHIYVNTYKEDPLRPSLKTPECFFLVPVTTTVVPINFFNVLSLYAFFTNAINLSIAAAPKVVTNLESNVNRTFKLKIYMSNIFLMNLDFLKN